MKKHYPECPQNLMVSQLIGIQAQAAVKPIVQHGKAKVYCLSFDVEQNYCRKEPHKAYYQLWGNIRNKTANAALSFPTYCALKFLLVLV